MTGESLAGMLGTQAWQVATVILVVAVLQRFVARQRPHLAQALWLLVIVKCLTPPIWTSPSGIFCWVQERWSSPAVKALAAAPASDTAPFAWTPHRTPAEIYQSDRSLLASSPSTTPAAQRSFLATQLSFRGTPGFHEGSLWILAMWIAGSLATCAVMVVRWWRFRRQLDSLSFADQETCASAEGDRGTQSTDGAERACDLDSLAEQLTTRLQLRCRVRVRVVDAAIGPAVVGLFRPTVLLPAVLVRELSPHMLEPILAHELVHLRRGDLWLCVVQCLTRAVWWFHPLVWWANSRLSDEIERCVDEEVVASLGYEPARYARSLLEVLERKRGLRAAPVLPGVRPLQVTKNRLERIMRLGHGSHPRTPWWCWICLAIAALFFVPGGVDDAAGRERKRMRRTSESASPAPSAPRPTPQPNASESPLPLAANESTWQTTPREPSVIRFYPLNSTIAAIEKLHDVPVETARRILKRHLSQMADQGVGEAVKLEFTPTSLVLQAPAAVHQRIAEELPRLEKQGLRQVRVQTRIIQAANLDRLLGAAPPPAVRPQSEPRSNGSSSLANPPSPRIDDLAVVDELLAKATEDRRTNILSAPKVLVWSGQKASIQDLVLRPYVVGFDRSGTGNDRPEWNPRIETFEEGSSLELLPRVIEGGLVRLQLAMRFSRIVKVETRSVAPGPGETARTIQVPQVDQRRLQTTVDIQPGKALVAGGVLFPLKGMGFAENEANAWAVVVDCQVIEPDLEALASPLEIRIYSVADLVVPIPHSAQVVVNASPQAKTYGSRSSSEPTRPRNDVPQRPAPQFAPLVALIKSTIAPDTWHDSRAGMSIEPVAENLSLVVKATDDIHQQIGLLFEQLRKLQDIQVSLEMVMFRTKDNHFPSKWAQGEGNKMEGDQRGTLRAITIPADQRSSLVQEQPGVQLPKVTQFNGRSVAISLPFSESSPPAPVPLTQAWFTLVPTASGDRKAVQLQIATGLDDPAELLTTAITRRLAGGDSLLVDVTEKVMATRAQQVIQASAETPIAGGSVPGVAEVVAQRVARQKDERFWMLITPRVIVVEEDRQTEAPRR